MSGAVKKPRVRDEIERLISDEIVAASAQGIETVSEVLAEEITARMQAEALAQERKDALERVKVKASADRAEANREIEQVKGEASNERADAQRDRARVVKLVSETAALTAKVSTLEQSLAAAVTTIATLKVMPKPAPLPPRRKTINPPTYTARVIGRDYMQRISEVSLKPAGESTFPAYVATVAARDELGQIVEMQVSAAASARVH